MARGVEATVAVKLRSAIGEAGERAAECFKSDKPADKEAGAQFKLAQRDMESALMRYNLARATQTGKVSSVDFDA